jgi:F-type H+-transporting ATPase subunit b
VNRRTAVFVAALTSAAPSVAFAAEGGSHLGIPDPVWMTLNLAAFLYFLYRFVGRPMGAFLQTRRADIARELREAQDKLREAETLRAQVVERLDAVEKEVVEIRARAEREGAAEAVRIAESARVEAERFVTRVQGEIERRGAETRQLLAAEAAELTANIARDLLQHELTEADRARLLDRSVEALASFRAED